MGDIKNMKDVKNVTVMRNTKNVNLNMKNKVNALIEEIFEKIVEIRRDFHSHPELSEQEIRTAKKICEYLDLWNIPYISNIAGNGIVASLVGKKPLSASQKFKVVAIRADMDALPITEKNDLPYKSKHTGIMHACGHDIHMATLLGSIWILKRLENEINGSIKFFFQPAEETIGGAKQMIEAGCLENPRVDAVLGLHVTPALPCGNVQFKEGVMNASSAEFSIHIKGTSCHGAYPHLGSDCILTASHILTALQSIVSRDLDPVKSGLISIGSFSSGTKGNILPAEAHLRGIIRTFDEGTKVFLKNRIVMISKNIAKALKTKAYVDFIDSYPVLKNDLEVFEIMKNTACKSINQENISFMENPSLSTDDFAYFTQAVQGLYFNLGTKCENELAPQVLHSEYFNPDEDCMKTGILMEVSGIFDLLNIKEPL